MSVGDIASREERPAYVRFERRPVEDMAASQREGRYVAKDVDYAMVTPNYSKDCFEQRVDRWFASLDRDAKNGRIPQPWVQQYKKMYEAWQNGQEMPLSGTPIRGWGLISPATQEMLIRMNCMTVEDLAAINDEGMKRIGMGALDLKNKAKNWLATLQDHGPIAQQMTNLETENRILKSQVDTLQTQVKGLLAAMPQATTVPESAPDGEITASDLLEDEPPAPRVRRGKPAPQPAEQDAI